MTDARERSIRPARLTDRQALVDLSRRVHRDPEGHRRSLGVPTPAGPPRISLSALIPSWLPLRPPTVHVVADEGGRLVGSCRAIEEPRREDWVITELDAVDDELAAETRYALLEALVATGGQRSVARFHVACSDVRENLELFGQAGFMAYSQEEILYLPPEPTRGPRSWLRGVLGRGSRRARHDGAAGSVAQLPAMQAAGPPDAWHLFDLWTHATPPTIARIEGYGASDWESVGQEAIVPRSSLNALLHFGDVHAWFLPHEQRVGGFVQHGTCRAGPHYLRCLVREGIDGPGFMAAALTVIGTEALGAGIVLPVRTYETAGLRAAGAVGFESIGRVTLLVREVRARVSQPALVPATR